MTDRLMALFAILSLVVFLGILIAYVPRLDLGAVVAITLALVLWDFFFANSRSNGS